MSTELRDSRKEKDEAWELYREIPHWMYVHELQELLKKLDPNDALVPNAVANLAILRGDGEDAFIGFIDFGDNNVELIEDDGEDEEEN